MNAEDIKEWRRRLKAMADPTHMPGRHDAEIDALCDLAIRPRISVMPIVKTLRDQRDEVANALREVMAKLREDFDQPEDIEPHAFTTSWESLMHRAYAILDKCPSYEQQLRNVAEGLGMTYEDLITAVNGRPE